MQEGYHPEKSKVSADKLSDFVRSPITGKLTEASSIQQISTYFTS